MTKSTFLLRRLAISLVAFVFVAGMCTTASAATKAYSLTGNSRAQIGDGLPIPIGFTPPPVGKIKADPGATAQQTTGVDPKAVRVAPGVLHYGTVSPFAAPNQNQPVFLFNTAVFQVRTQLAISGGAIPQASTSIGGTQPFWKKHGRTGAPVVSFCPGDVVTASGNPACTITGAVIPGRLIYTATKAQFGGPAQSIVVGNADVALRVAGTPNATTPTVTAIFAFASPAPTGAVGAPFGFVNTTPGTAPGPASGFGKFKATPFGALTSVISQPPVSGKTNPVTEYGGPWTTGKVTVEQKAAVGSPEIFVFSGSDARVGGKGSLSLVAGSISDRTLSGPNANRGWVNLELGSLVPTPAMSSHGLAAVFGLLALAAGYAMQRRRTLR